MWTHFMDMHSGGSRKEKFYHCYIEAPINEAKIIFYDQFGHDPDFTTCDCCGADYFITEYETLEQATAYERGCKFDKEKNLFIDEPGDRGDYIPLSEYINSDDDIYIIMDFMNNE